MTLSSVLDILSRHGDFQPIKLLENVLSDLESALSDLQKAPASQSSDLKEENRNLCIKLEKISRTLKNSCDVYAKCLEFYQNDCTKKPLLCEKAKTLAEISMKLLGGSLNPDCDVSFDWSSIHGTAISVLEACFAGAPLDVQSCIIRECCDSIELFSHDKQFTYGAVSGE